MSGHGPLSEQEMEDAQGFVYEGDVWAEKAMRMSVELAAANLRIKSLEDQQAGRAQGASEETVRRIAAWLEKSGQVMLDDGLDGAALIMAAAAHNIREGEWK